MLCIFILHRCTILGLTVDRALAPLPHISCEEPLSGHAHTGNAWDVVHFSLPQRFNGNSITRK